MACNLRASRTQRIASALFTPGLTAVEQLPITCIGCLRLRNHSGMIVGVVIQSTPIEDRHDRLECCTSTTEERAGAVGPSHSGAEWRGRRSIHGQEFGKQANDVGCCSQENCRSATGSVGKDKSERRKENRLIARTFSRPNEWDHFPGGSIFLFEYGFSVLPDCFSNRASPASLYLFKGVNRPVKLTAFFLQLLDDPIVIGHVASPCSPSGEDHDGHGLRRIHFNAKPG
jgi:hypothetical protein